MFSRIRGEIRRFFHCERSAVTVIVTFLLVPAILITGTGVEFARIFANRAMTERAGELAANAALTQYDAILQDMYGLYAIAMTDDELSDLLDEYVKAAFDEGESSLWLNAGDASASLNTTDSNYYLSRKEVLARQIQEYCKIRGIGALANDLIDKFNIFDFSKLKVDLDIFDKKLETDDQFKALLEQYSDFYYRMRYNDYFVESGTRGVISKLNEKIIEGGNLVTSIRTIVEDMQTYKEQYDDAPNNYEDDELTEFRNECRDNFNEQKDELLRLVDDFTSDFPKFTHSSPNSEHKAGASEKPRYVDVVAEITGYNALEALFQQPGSNIDYYSDNFENPDCLMSYSYNLEQIIGSAKAINVQIDDFKAKQIELNNAVNNGSDLTQSTMTNQSEVYDRYMNKIDVDGVVTSIANNNKEYITDYQSYFLNSMFTYSGTQIGYNDIRAKVNSLGISSSVAMFNALKGISFLDYDQIYEWGAFCKHKTDGLSGNPFASISPDGLQELYWILALQYVNTDAGTAKSKVESALNNIGKSISGLTENLLKGLQPYPIGHDYIPGELILPSQGIGTANATDSFTVDLDEMGESNKQTRTSLKDLKNIISSFTASALDSVADKTLMTVYATHIFSNYATAKKESMAGYKYNAQLNYMQGAEQEYIIIGNRDGLKNLTAFGAIIIAIRTVLNFASTFVVPEINALVNSVASAAAAAPFVGPALYLLVQGGLRLALAVGESFVDLYLLRKGNSVLIFKFKSGDFVVGSPIGFAKFTAGLAESAAKTAIGAGVSLTKDLIEDAVSTGDLELKTETNPGHTSAKLLDAAAKAKLDNSSDASDFAALGIDAAVDVYKDYYDRLDKYAKEQSAIEKQQYLQNAAEVQGLEGSDRSDFIDGYNTYITSYHPIESDRNEDYENIKEYFDTYEEKIKNDIEYYRNNPDVEIENVHYNDFISKNSGIMQNIGLALKDDVKKTFEQFTPQGMIDNIKKKFSLGNILKVDYSFYTGVWILLTVNRDKLIMRMADLISLNVANKSSKLTPVVGDYENFAAFGYDVGYAATYSDDLANGRLPPMTQEIFDKYTLDKRRSFIQTDVAYDMKWTFISLGIFQSDPMETGRVFPATFPIRASVYRGY